MTVFFYYQNLSVGKLFPTFNDRRVKKIDQDTILTVSEYRPYFWSTVSDPPFPTWIRHPYPCRSNIGVKIEVSVLTSALELSLEIFLNSCSYN